MRRKISRSFSTLLLNLLYASGFPCSKINCHRLLCDQMAVNWFLHRFLTRTDRFPSQKRSWEEITRCVINPKECLKVTRIWIWTKLMSNWRRIINMIWISLLTCSFHPCENHAWISWHQCANLQDSIKKKQSTLDNLFPPSLRYNLSLDGILSEGHERLCNHTKITSSKHSQEPFRCETYFAWQLLSRYPE